ncbi:cytochrome c oxidase subunit 4 [Lysinibacillus composti]|uniref:Cytochrome B6 n=1 Tax=Lysinibacillus composti TaxID=720633 RepID=A0A3N9UG23_9BACI|nr:cytochrome C oxidase subunit IV family protein [Lysinibacillus composti]MBM7608237.1 cytochrome c oxidase subunit 4 [Lysinibacillus composti]RQW75077.1 cytochrome B6 [Lysinibacillus composti]
MAHNTQVQIKTKAEFEYERHHNAVHMRKQVVNFAIMIFLTFVAFASVAAGFSKYFVVPVILLLAAVQVVLQLYSFMHMDDKKTHHMGIIQTFVWSGVLIIFPIFVTFLTIIWW